MKDELLRIAKQAKAKRACGSQLKKFKQLVEQEDYLQAWQTVLGNKQWLEENRIILPDNLEELANNVGKTWHKNGRLWEEETYKDGKRHGSCKLWYPNGQLEVEATFKDGYLHGPYAAWYSNGQLCIEANYTNGKLHGLYRRYGNDGELLEVTYYVNGNIVER